jgi:hypothetical protein
VRPLRAVLNRIGLDRGARAQRLRQHSFYSRKNLLVRQRNERISCESDPSKQRIVALGYPELSIEGIRSPLEILLLPRSIPSSR